MKHDNKAKAFTKEQSGNGPKLVLNTYTGASREGEAFVTDHIFSCIISGSHDVWIAGRKYSFKKGDCRFFKRNQLAKYVKNTAEGGFKSIAIHIDQLTLKEMSRRHNIVDQKEYQGDELLWVDQNIQLKAFIDSLIHYSAATKPSDSIVSLKTQELILLLMQNDLRFKHILFDFSEPAKIDLEPFMNRHYRYNVSLKGFAFLTGRSLSAFKRDFEKLFQISPGKWLTQKRLQEAKFRIEEKREKPTQIYPELGFQDLSHFSYAYKKAFGYAPNKSIQINKNQ